MGALSFIRGALSGASSETIRNSLVQKRNAGPVASVDGGRGWFRIFESFSGAWQRNVTVTPDSVFTNDTLFACMTLIASDMAKMSFMLVEWDKKQEVYEEIVENSPFLKVLRKPNHFQNHIQFKENWMLSKLMRGNVYVLKERDERGVVTRLYILDPNRVTVKIGEDGSVWYELATDTISQLRQATVTVPASEIIHDRFNTLFHPLVGISPVAAAALTAMGGIKMQEHAVKLFGNNARPGGILTASNEIGEEATKKLRDEWNAAFSGDSAGKVAVLGEGLTFSSLAQNNKDAELISQMEWSANAICSVFHIPSYKVNVGEMPKYDNIQALDTQYLTQCLQKHINDMQTCMDEGIGLDTSKDGKWLEVKLDIDELLRMDQKTLTDSLKSSIAGGFMTPDEARKKINLAKVEGGDSAYMQEQNYSLSALAKRDAKEDPFAKSASGAAQSASNDNEEVEDEQSEAAKMIQAATKLALNLGLPSQ